VLFFVSSSYLSVTTFHKFFIRPLFVTTGDSVSRTLRVFPNWKTKVRGDHNLLTNFKYTQNTEYTRHRELLCFAWKNNSSSSIYINVSATCSSQNVQTVLDFTACVSRHLNCHRSNCIVESCTKINHTTNFWTEYVVLYIASKEKNSNGVYRGSEGARPIHLSGNVLFRDYHCKAPEWRGTIFMKEKIWLKVCHLRDCK
jgi:hypothetical protein